MRHANAPFTVRTQSTRASPVLAWALAFVGLATSAYAGAVSEYNIDKDPNHVLYGTLNQNLVPGWGNVACAPIAAVNSFVYLQNKYPTIYDNKLVNPNNPPAGMIAAVQTLGTAPFMNTIANGGTFNDDFIYGKWLYLEQNAPGLTVYEAQNSFGWNVQRNGQAIAKPAWVNQMNPTWQFLWNELVSCEDVEIGLQYFGSTDVGHMLTLASFHWRDAIKADGTDGSDGVIQRGENATIDYIDPLTGAKGISFLWQDPISGRLETNYGVAGGWIHLAVSESPIPLPPALWSGLALLATAPVIRLIRKRAA
ncbi:MAG: hypothetical protein NTU53_05995 [Planctomycetota bacterium]|nr:hypothetical protein [Planctomycetota bacterium]